jgi:hypothetical protein
MSGLATLLTPWERGGAIELGNRVWRKRVLPVGDVQYQGRMLHFTKQYNDGLAAAFADRAYDQVSFQLADAANTHTNDPERHRGTVTDMRSEPVGLWMYLQPTQRGERVLKENPYLGVSARIVEQYERSDGKFYPAAVQHVLGTLDPRIPGLGAWQTIEAANTPALVIDLTSASYAGQENEMPELTAAQQANLSKLLDMDPAALDRLIGGSGGPPQPPAPQTQTQPQPQGDGNSPDDELTDAELADLIDAMSDEELGALEDEFMAETGAGMAATGLTAEAQMAIDLANSRADETERQLGVFQQQFDVQRYEGEKRSLADLGVPPYITELARPLLQGSNHTVDLANGSRVDAGQVMRKVLSEYAKMAQMLDLSTESGSLLDEPLEGQQDAASTARQELVTRARQQMGLG